MPAQRGIYPPACHHDALYQGLVFPLQRAVLQLLDKLGMSAQRAGDYQQPESIFIEPVHDTGAWQGRKIWVMMEQRIEQGALAVARPRMHHPTRRLIDNDQILVLVADIHGKCLWLPTDLGFRLYPEDNLFASHHHIARPWLAVIDQQPALQDPGLKERPRIVCKDPGQRLVESRSRELMRDLDFARVSLSHRHLCLHCPVIGDSTKIKQSTLS